MVEKRNPETGGMENTAGALDGEQIYCRMLGHHINFSYCREAGNGLFCSKMASCWGGKIDISAFLKTRFTPEQIEQALQPPKPKMTTLYELIQQAKAGMIPEDETGA